MQTNTFKRSHHGVHIKSDKNRWFSGIRYSAYNHINTNSHSTFFLPFFSPTFFRECCVTTNFRSVYVWFRAIDLLNRIYLSLAKRRRFYTSAHSFSIRFLISNSMHTTIGRLEFLNLRKYFVPTPCFETISNKMIIENWGLLMIWESDSWM